MIEKKSYNEASESFEKLLEWLNNDLAAYSKNPKAVAKAIQIKQRVLKSLKEFKSESEKYIESLENKPEKVVFVSDSKESNQFHIPQKYFDPSEKETVRYSSIQNAILNFPNLY